MFGLMANVHAAGVAKHVVVVVWDGMRPDFISTNHTPVLAQLAHDGVFFVNHHSVYCTATEVNATALATGAYPAHSGIIANNDFLPTIRPLQSVVTTTPGVVARGDKLTGGNFLQCPTLAETLQAAGQTTAIAGSKTVTLLHDRRARVGLTNGVVFKGNTRSAALQEIFFNQLDEFPEANGSDANKARDEWTRRTLTDILWTNGVPAFSLLWLSEPDHSQHAAGPGSERALKALESSDEQLGAVLKELEKRKLRDQADVFVVSDHGFSTTDKSVDVAKILREAGFNAQRKFKTPPQNGDIMVVGQGGTVLFFVIGHEAEVTRRLVQCLQQQEFSGVIFAAEPLAGVFPLAAANINRAQNSPDVVLSLRWSDAKSKTGARGMFWLDSDHKPAIGSHASLSRFDLHNTLVAAGPDLKVGLVSEIASGNVDLAPTILALLGVKQLQPMDGRVLSEALTVAGLKAIPFVPQSNRLEAAATNGAVIWRQYLQTTKVGQTVYLDEGNGRLAEK